MQIDAHHLFVQDWDTKCIEMLHSCDAGEYSILSTYAPDYEQVENADFYNGLSGILYKREVKAQMI